MSKTTYNVTTNPGTPASGKLNIWANTASKRLNYTDDIGATGPVGMSNGWIDVTQQGTSSVLTSNSGGTNNTNIAAIMSAAASGSVIYFPGGFYPFSSVIAIPAKVFTFQGSGSGINGNLAAFYWTSNVSGDLITLTGGNYYTQFRDLGFITAITQTAGAVVNTGDNAYTNFYRCTFSGLDASKTLKDCINFTGTHAGEISVVEYCTFTNWTGKGIIGGSNLSTTIVQGCTMSTAGAATCGINVTIGGAFQIDNCDIIGPTNCLLINPTSPDVVASIYCTNSYFDNSAGSCCKISGSGASVRNKFTMCSFTVSATASPANAVEVSSTFAYGSTGMGLDIINCNIINTFGSTGVGTGINITGAADFIIQGNNISNWGVGIDVTSANAAGMTQPVIQGNSIGPSGGYAGNTTGVRFNAGSFAYGAVLLQNNNLQGNTTNLTNNAGVGTGTAATGQIIITDNAGLITCPPANYAANLIPITTVTSVDTRGGLLIPTSARPSSGTITAYATNAATAQTPTITMRYGTNNSNADAAIFTFVHTAGTAAVGSGLLVVDWELLTATTIGIHYKFFNGNNAATGMAAGAVVVSSGLSTAATISTAANNWLGLYISCATAGNVITFRSVKYEIQSQ